MRSPSPRARLRTFAKLGCALALAAGPIAITLAQFQVSNQVNNRVNQELYGNNGGGSVRYGSPYSNQVYSSRPYTSQVYSSRPYSSQAGVYNYSNPALPSEVRYARIASGALPSEIALNRAAIGPLAPEGAMAYIPQPRNTYDRFSRSSGPTGNQLNPMVDTQMPAAGAITPSAGGGGGSYSAIPVNSAKPAATPMNSGQIRYASVSPKAISTAVPSSTPPANTSYIFQPLSSVASTPSSQPTSDWGSTFDASSPKTGSIRYGAP